MNRKVGQCRYCGLRQSAYLDVTANSSPLGEQVRVQGVVRALARSYRSEGVGRRGVEMGQEVG